MGASQLALRNPMTLMINFSQVNKKLFAGPSNGRLYKPSCSNHSHIDIVFNSDQVVTSSFFYGLLEDVLKRNPDVSITITGGQLNVRCELSRAIRRYKDN